MGNVLDFPGKGPTDPERRQVGAYIIGIDYARGPDWTIVCERDLDTNQWTWRAHSVLGNSNDMLENGTHPRITITLQQDPQVLYTTPSEAQDAALLSISELPPLSK